MAYLDAYLDPALDIPKGETPKKITVQEVKRLNHLLAVATAAQKIQRRLGADASDEEIARDKVQSRRIAHVARQCIAAWDDVPKKRLEKCESEAAQIVWANWAAEHQTRLLNRMRYIATWQYKYSTEELWAKSAVVRLNNELS